MHVGSNHFPAIVWCLVAVLSKVNMALCTMHYLGIPRHTHSMIIYKILTEFIGQFKQRIALWECCHKLIIISLFTQLVPEGELDFHTLYKRNVDDEKAHSESETLFSQLSLGK